LGPHAERVAFDRVTDPSKLKGATAYVTLEPCSHYGNQPPCVNLLANSEISRVVIARPDPNPLINGQGIKILRSAGKKVSIGLNHSEATAWNFPFFAYQRLRRPIFILKWAQTLDGQLADDQNKSQWITGPAARAYTHWLRQRYDLILVGANTLLADSPKLTVRNCTPPHQSQPLPVIFDPRGKLLNADPIVQERIIESTLAGGRRSIYLTLQTSLQASPLQNWLRSRLPNNLILTLNQDTQSSEITAEQLFQLSSILASPTVSQHLGRPVQSIMIEGGPQTLSIFLKAGLADLLHVFIAPIISGGLKNRIQLMEILSRAKRFELVSSLRLGPDTVMEMVQSELTELFHNH
jgi:diaminohydroxyphosphoribosylaminopyrimidine deaminase/5-amino-6-(5-phosphoribosylamino)uracil reductase